MSELYNLTPSSFGGFDANIESTSNGYYEQAFGVPYNIGRSTLASLPDYIRMNPILFEQGLLRRIQEGRPNMMRLLSDIYSQAPMYVNDVRYHFPIEIEQSEKFYIKQGAYAVADNKTVFKVDVNNTPIKTANPDGQPNSVGEIARLRVGMIIVLMFSWTTPKRDQKPAYNGLSPAVTGSGNNFKTIPENCKITAIDYTNGFITVERNWAGAQRTTVPTAPDTVTIVANTTTTDGVKVKAKHAFFLPVAASVPEDEIDAKGYNMSGTWSYGLLQREIAAWGGRRMAEVVAKNYNHASPMAKSRELAVKDYFTRIERAAIFNEKEELWDPITKQWMGRTDGILANIPSSHFVALKAPDYASKGSSAGWLGSFDPVYFNKILENKGYIGSSTKYILCGAEFHTAASTMFNSLSVANTGLITEWGLNATKYRSSNGLDVVLIPSDAFSLHGMNHLAVMFDPSHFKRVGLKGYPTDIYEINNENPNFTNGFIQGVFGFQDTNPDAHWVFSLVPKTSPDGRDNATAYAAIDPLGTPKE